MDYQNHIVLTRISTFCEALAIDTAGIDIVQSKSDGRRRGERKKTTGCGKQVKQTKKKQKHRKPALKAPVQCYTIPYSLLRCARTSRPDTRVV